MARKQDELQSSSFLQIFKESFKLIFSYPKIFIQITLFFLLPLSCMSLATYIEFSPPLPSNIFPNTTFYGTPIGSPANYNKAPDAPQSKVDFHRLALMVFSQLLTVGLNIIPVSTAVYAVACILTGKEITFRKAISVIPQVWKQLLMTYATMFCICFAIFAVYFFVVVIGIVVIISYSSNSSKSFGGLVGGSIAIIIVSLLLMVGLIFINIIWILADVVSVTEKTCGMKALKKSKSLIKGRMGTTVGVYLVLSLCVLPNVVFLQKLKNDDASIREKICYGILALVLSTLVALLTIVVKTVLYFVCKSYHHEPIDKLSWVDYIGISDVDRLPLNMKETKVGVLQV